MMALSFWWLTAAVVPLLLVCFLFGLALGVAFWWWHKNQHAAQYENFIAEAETERERLNLRVSSLETAEERVVELEKVLETDQKDIKKFADISENLAIAKTKIKKSEERVKTLERQIAEGETGPKNSGTKGSVVNGKEKIEKIESKYQITREELSKERKQRGEVSAELKNAKAKISELSASSKNYEKTIRGLESKLSDANASTPQSNSNSAGLVISLRRQLAEAQSGMENVAALKKKVADLESDIDSCDSHNSKNQSSEVSRKPRSTDWQKGTTKLGLPGAAHIDDLKVIKGIGPVMEKTLQSFGIQTWEQVAAFTKEDIAKVTKAIDAFPGRIERDDWVGGAQALLDQRRPES